MQLKLLMLLSLVTVSFVQASDSKEDPRAAAIAAQVAALKAKREAYKNGLQVQANLWIARKSCEDLPAGIVRDRSKIRGNVRKFDAAMARDLPSVQYCIRYNKTGGLDVLKEENGELVVVKTFV
jgi:hypothetical protein